MRELWRSLFLKVCSDFGTSWTLPNTLPFLAGRRSQCSAAMSGICFLPALALLGLAAASTIVALTNPEVIVAAYG